MKKILKLTSKVTVLVLLFSLTGCYYNEVMEQPPITSQVSFSADIQPILTANCTACHNGSLNPNLTAGNAYASLMSLPSGSIIAGNADGSELVDMLEHNPAADNPMPPSGAISTAKIELIKAWIDQGALNN